MQYLYMLILSDAEVASRTGIKYRAFRLIIQANLAAEIFTCSSENKLVLLLNLHVDVQSLCRVQRSP